MRTQLCFVQCFRYPPIASRSVMSNKYRSNKYRFQNGKNKYPETTDCATKSPARSKNEPASPTHTQSKWELPQMLKPTFKDGVSEEQWLDLIYSACISLVPVSMESQISEKQISTTICRLCQHRNDTYERTVSYATL